MARKMDWIVVGRREEPEPIRPTEAFSYDLLNVTTSDSIKYGERRWGINLVWGEPTDGDAIRFQTKDRRPDPIRLGERFAIAVRGGGWLVYRQRRFGVNLAWSDAPSYEWAFSGNGKSPAAAEGDVATTSRVYGLYNDVERDLLMYESRPLGINLKWFKDAGDLFPGMDLADVVDDAVDVAKVLGPVFAAA